MYVLIFCFYSTVLLLTDLEQEAAADMHVF